MTLGSVAGGSLVTPLSLSWRALGYFGLIGIPAVLVTVPDVAGSGLKSWRWWLVAMAGQLACTIVAVSMRPFVTGTWSTQKVLAVLLLAGAARGAVIAWSGQMLEVIPSPSWLARIGNSALVTAVILGLLGIVLRASRDYEQQYATLVQRAVAIEVARREGDAIDLEVLQSWSSVKRRIDEAIHAARETLALPGEARALRSASRQLRTAVDSDVRPAGRRWIDSAPPTHPPRLRGRALLAQALDPWRPPVGAVVGTLALIVGFGSLVRLGVATAVPYTVFYLVAVAATLYLSTLIARRTKHVRLVAVSALLLLVPLVYALGLLVTTIPGVVSDPIGGALVAAQTPATVLVVSMIVRLASERRAVLASLQRTIDSGTVALLATEVRRRTDATNLGTYVHHSVQSEMLALAIQLDEAAQSSDELLINDVRWRVLERLALLEAVDPNEPPWLRSKTGRERIDEIVLAWQGIASVELDLAATISARYDQWHIAAQIVEEGIANAIRHGGARSIGVTARMAEGALVVEIEDDGILGVDEPGTGSRWLDLVLGDSWSRAAQGNRTRLRATIR